MYASIHWATESDVWNQGFTVNDWQVSYVGQGNVYVITSVRRSSEMAEEKEKFTQLRASNLDDFSMVFQKEKGYRGRELAS